ncbi:YbaB/EbfC family nucleoid-associated protein [Mycobacterium sp. TY814]|uniref:YbaB/EbfC family nucleoid-associated protein n=1 Tax=unclassified Mycobacterium TaxID=2642494 RepID=UPI0027403FD8|nr:YbaB/EbfC family nucleoid-associated protein [Mycobacterium sp. TY814]MDP7720714.1 YbaB/EbfC family nucleoid-associated protein [Mycobacterium sp. TY814]
MASNDFEELGRKVQRAQHGLEHARGVGTANGIRVVVDAENRLLSVTAPDEEAILAAYNAAVDDVRPLIEQAMREVRADPRVEAMSTFVEANSARLHAECARSASEDDDDTYYDDRFRRGWRDR